MDPLQNPELMRDAEIALLCVEFDHLIKKWIMEGLISATVTESVIRVDPTQLASLIRTNSTVGGQVGTLFHQPLRYLTHDEAVDEVLRRRI